MQQAELTRQNVQGAHKMLSQQLLPSAQRRKIRNQPMHVLSEEDRIGYVACAGHRISKELESLFKTIEKLSTKTLPAIEAFYYASLIHLVFVKIHPFLDGNGRTARLLEKWF